MEDTEQTEIASMSVSDEYDDTLDDLNGVCLFDLADTRIAQRYSWAKPAQPTDWAEFADRCYWLNKSPIYVRIIDPGNPRFGSIAKVRSFYSGRVRQGIYPNSQAANLATSRRTTIHLKWANYKSTIRIRIPEIRLEFLPDYSGPTVWNYDRSRSKRREPAIVYDRLNREIKVGDFCAYILYQFEHGSGASICFGTVTDIDHLGQVWCKNIPMHEKMASEEKKVKDPKLITVMTDDLMDLLFVKKLSM